MKTDLGWLPMHKIGRYTWINPDWRSSMSSPCLTTALDEMAGKTAILAEDVAVSQNSSAYPKIFASRVSGRSRRRLGDHFGLANFGINLTSLLPMAMSSLRHAHTKQDEFIYVLQGSPTLYVNEGRFELSPGMCAGFRASTGNAHHLVNETNDLVVFLEIGDRSPGDEGAFPDDDLKAVLLEGIWKFTHKDGRPYD